MAGDYNVIRLDPDNLRCKFPGYNGANSYLFQRAISVIIERALDYAFQGKQSFLLDGTLSKLDIAKKNIQGCLDRKRNTSEVECTSKGEFHYQVEGFDRDAEMLRFRIYIENNQQWVQLL